MTGFIDIGGLWAVVWLNSRHWLGSSMSVCCGVISVVREWVAGFNTVYVWVGLWVDRFVVVGVGLVDFFFFVVGCGGGGGGCGCGCGCDGCV